MGNELSAAACLQVAMGDVTSYVPDDRRKLTYHLIMALFVISVLSCILANAGACYRLWRNRHQLIERGYFGIVFQANICYALIGLSYFFATVPIAIFLTKDMAEKYSTTVVYFVAVIIHELAIHSLPLIHLYCAIYTYGLIADPVNLVKIERVLCWVTGVIWAISAIIALSVSLFSCSYTYNVYSAVYDYKCDNIYNKYNTRTFHWAVEYSQTILNLLTCIIICVALWRLCNSKVKILSSSVDNTLSIEYILLVAFQTSYITSSVSHALPSADLWVFPQKRIFDTVCYRTARLNYCALLCLEWLLYGNRTKSFKGRPSSVGSITSCKSRPCTVG